MKRLDPDQFKDTCLSRLQAIPQLTSIILEFAQISENLISSNWVNLATQVVKQ